METIGQRVLNLRKKRKLTQRNLALKVNTAHSTIGRIERDEVIPEGKTLEALSKFFNVSFEYLLTGEEKNTDNNQKIVISPNDDFQFALFDKIKGKELTEKQKNDILNIIDVLTKEED